MNWIPGEAPKDGAHYLCRVTYSVLRPNIGDESWSEFVVLQWDIEDKRWSWIDSESDMWGTTTYHVKIEEPKEHYISANQHPKF
jgi:hypothetical protein